MAASAGVTTENKPTKSFVLICNGNPASVKIEWLYVWPTYLWIYANIEWISLTFSRVSWTPSWYFLLNYGEKPTNQQTGTGGTARSEIIKPTRGQTSMFQLGRLVLFSNLHHQYRFYSRDQSNTGHRELFKSWTKKEKQKQKQNPLRKFGVVGTSTTRRNIPPPGCSSLSVIPAKIPARLLFPTPWSPSNTTL